MRCIFCKCSSAATKSVEHTIPESLGNVRHVLPKGAVCDRCNNYFARKVENPVLSHHSFRNLRARHGIRSKSGRQPSFVGLQISSGFEVAIQLNLDGGICLKAEHGKTSQDVLKHLEQDEERGLHAFAVNFALDPPKMAMSRLLAKIALERCFHDFVVAKKRPLDIILDPYFDNVRRWARSGDNFPNWPYHQRTIYPGDTLMRHPQTNEWVKAGIGQGLFHTDAPETYFSICLYGTEFVINVGGPNIDGFERWLRQNNQASPFLTHSRQRVAFHNDMGSTTYRLERQA